MPLKDGALNQIKAFAPDGNEIAGDLMDLDAYEIDPLRLRGHQPGIARRHLANRTWRQCAHMAAGLAQFIANRYPPGVLDDGDLDRVETGLFDAIRSVVLAEVPEATTTDFGKVLLATVAQTLGAVHETPIPPEDRNRTVTLEGLARALAAFAPDLSNLVINTRKIIAGTGLTGGGTLDGDRTLNIDFATPEQTIEGKRNDLAVHPAGLAAALDAHRRAAAGTIIVFAGQTPPAGVLRCNGAAISRTTYAALFAAVGTIYGSGDGATTFNIPDLRGEFLRGVDDGRGVDSGRELGSAQGDAMRNLTGSIGGTGWGYNYPETSGIFKLTAAQHIIRNAANVWQGFWTLDLESAGIPTAPENRPRNVAVQYCIAY